MDPRIVAAMIGLAGVVLGSVGTMIIQARIAKEEREHGREMAERERRSRWRMAAVDKRLLVHQEAYALWHDLLWACSGRDTEALMEVIEESQNWWRDNCLYLDRSVRGPFRACVNLAGTRQELLASQAEAELVKTVYQEMREVGRLIEEAVGLPPVAGGESLAGSELGGPRET